MELTALIHASVEALDGSDAVKQLVGICMRIRVSIRQREKERKGKARPAMAKQAKQDRQADGSSTVVYMHALWLKLCGVHGSGPITYLRIYILTVAEQTKASGVVGTRSLRRPLQVCQHSPAGGLATSYPSVKPVHKMPGHGWPPWSRPLLLAQRLCSRLGPPL